MNPTINAFLRSWPFAPWLAASLLVSACFYARGWYELHRRDPERWGIGRLLVFMAGLLAIYLALASPVEPFASLLLSMHMLQHLLLMMVAPPLVWLGHPLFPMLRGFPAPVRTYWIVPLLRVGWIRQMFSALTHPLVAWPIYVATTWLWHIPSAYELGLANDAWHFVQHGCFIGSALLFWYSIVRPYPSKPSWPNWLIFPYLLLADVQNTVLAAWFTFASRELYAYYTKVPRLGQWSALEDQHLAGVLMWVPGSIVFLVPMFWLGIRYLLEGEKQSQSVRSEVNRRRTVVPRRSFDLLHVPVVGRLLRGQSMRRLVQLALGLIAVIVVVDGLVGPQVGAMNLAGVLPWIHWRGVLILSLLVAGNFFCMACPFTLPRTLARRYLPTGRHWPRALCNKWLATVLVILFLWSYEAFSLWDNPWVTAWIILGYFVAAFVVDSFFAGASFCKYVCPIGQFNFVQSLNSPLEVKVQAPAVCATCETKDCIRGNADVLGCELQLFQPKKQGNLDCTFCLDCVRACPHENVGVLAGKPLRLLASDVFRSGIGRIGRRWDLAALVLVLVFGAFANAAGMIEPVIRVQEKLSLRFGELPRFVVVTASYACALLLLPTVCAAVAAYASSRWGNPQKSVSTIARRFSYSLVPIGFAMWLSHYSFHFFTSWATILPTTQRFVADRGWQGAGSPLWQCACCQDAPAWVLNLELLMLDMGLLASLYVALQVAESLSTSVKQTLKTLLPWAALIVLLFSLGVWILLKPMEMRGTLSALG